MIARLIYRGITIAVDVFSQKKAALKPNETRVLDNNKPLKPQLYEALSGNKWDKFLEDLEI